MHVRLSLFDVTCFLDEYLVDFIYSYLQVRNLEEKNLNQNIFCGNTKAMRRFF